LKAAILTAVGGSKNEKETARGVVRFRKLLDFVRSFSLPDYSFIYGPSIAWDDFLKFCNISEVIQNPFTDEDERPAYIRRPAYLLVRPDGTFYELDRIFDPSDMAVDWGAFMGMSSDVRQVIFDTLSELRDPSVMRRYVRLVPMSVDEYRAELQRKKRAPEETAL
jgi:hypothetical protein